MKKKKKKRKKEEEKKPTSYIPVLFTCIYNSVGGLRRR